MDAFYISPPFFELPTDAISLASNESWENLTAEKIAVILEHSEKGKQGGAIFCHPFRNCIRPRWRKA
jgi:hypothetical protein